MGGDLPVSSGRHAFLQNPSPAHAEGAWESRRAISAEAIGKFNAGRSPATGLKLLPQKQGITDGRLFTMADGRLFTTV